MFYVFAKQPKFVSSVQLLVINELFHQSSFYLKNIVSSAKLLFKKSYLHFSPGGEVRGNVPGANYYYFLLLLLSSIFAIDDTPHLLIASMNVPGANVLDPLFHPTTPTLLRTYVTSSLKSEQSLHEQTAVGIMTN